ncbi:MAG: DNA polymerase III subunit beta [Ruminococcaceae bacterium]|nr:DNA polymerase III subunit beta [Oscillospiraceae bacterium]
MKFTCSTMEMAVACSTVAKAVSQKAAIPSIEGILIKAEEGKVSLTGYDLEMAIITKIEAAIEEEGSIVIDARTLCEILRKMPGEMITITADERKLCTLNSGNSEFSLNGMGVEDYPELPSVQNGKEIQIDTELFTKMIRKTVFACAVVDTRPIFMGVKFEIEDNELRMIALDGFRLAIRKEKIDYSAEKLEFIVPSKTLNEIVKISTETDEDIEISLGKRHIVFTIGTYSIISRLIEGEFLNYSRTIPAGSKTQTVVSTDELLKAIERTAIVITDRVKSPVRCIFSGNEIKMNCITNTARVNDRISASVLGEKIEIGFNSKYFIDALKNVDCDEIKIEMIDSIKPIKITPVDSDNFLFIIMPVRLTR